MATLALYLQDTYLLECDAVIVGINPAEDGEYAIILDQTVFYPQGGGQPTDKGSICGRNGEQFEVRQVAKNRDTSEITHFGRFVGANKLAASDLVHCKIDSERRLLHARYHLAGHLLDLALIELGVYDKWESVCGNHSPGSAYVEFRPDADSGPDQVASIFGRLESTCRDLIARNLRCSCIQVPQGSLPPRALKMLNEQMRALPSLRINRVEGIDAYWMPCGGTLCKSLGEINGISLPKYSFKKGLLRISYKVL
jgi:alanyl-tRNA synthetase